VECLLASALLAGVLIAISGLFILGTKSVQSGRELTKATTIANSAMEQVMSWPFASVYGFAGAIGADTTKTFTTALANPVYTGDANDVAEWGTIADAWRADVQEQLHEGEVTYRVDGVGRLPDGVDPGLVSYLEAPFLRVTVTVWWTEGGGRRRHVTFEEITL
jgi:hypothetical protein